MISIEKACEIVTKKRKEPFVTDITDVKRGYVIGTSMLNGEVADIPPVFIDKDSGQIESYFVPDHFDELRAGKKVDIPLKYQFKN